MPTFRSTEHLYKVFGALFDRVKREPAIAARLGKAGMVVRFRFRDPEGTITVDLRQDPIAYTFGPSDLEHQVEFTQSGDAAHRFWLGRLSVARAIATRKVIARGSVPKALALLPAIKPVFALYPQVLEEIGEAALVPPAKTRGRRKPGVFGRLLARKRPVLASPAGIAPPMQLVEDAGGDVEVVAQRLPDTDEALKLEMLRRMLLIRAFEERFAAEFREGTVPAEALHLSVGQEACAVGACFALAPGDSMATTHRGHGHMIAMGAGVEAMAAELFGKATGLCGGLGGCMHVIDASLGAIGANGIVGASSLMAVGAALSSKMQKTDRVAIAFMGDGATAQGMFHEALNFAAVFDLPAVFFVENNGYAEFTPVRGHARVERIADRARGYGVPGETVDGNDVWEVYEAVRRAAERARRGQGPSLIEGLTYRFTGHSEGESASYRTDAEIRSWRERDPIVRWRDALTGSGLLSGESASAAERAAGAAVDRAVGASLAAPEPTPDDAARAIYAPEPRVLYTAEPPRPAGATREASVSEALREALAEEIARDERVYLIGEDVTTGGYFAVTSGLVERFGTERIVDTPISEYAIVGSSVGAAMCGMRPVAEIQFSDFITCCMDPLVNQAAKLRLMSGGQVRIPLVVRTPGGAGIGMAAQHSQSLEAWLMHIPGLIVMAPGTAYDAKGLLKAAIRSNNPVVFFENKLLYTSVGPVPEEDYLVPIGKADVKRRGEDVTLVAVGAMVEQALEAASRLEADGVDVEVVDPRTLFPCDWGAIVGSAARTGRVVVAEAGVATCGFGAECAARIGEAAWDALRAPVRRVAAKHTPIPYNRALENATVPGADEIVEAVRTLL